MTLLILDRFWNSSNIESTLVKLPSVLNTEKKQEAFCLYYDNNSLLQLLVVLIIPQISLFSIHANATVLIIIGCHQIVRQLKNQSFCHKTSR